MNAPLPARIPRYTLAEIADAMNAHRTSVARRAEKESWPFEQVAVRGGKQRLYPLATLPKPIRDSIHAWEAKRVFGDLPAAEKTTADFAVDAVKPPKTAVAVQAPGNQVAVRGQVRCVKGELALTDKERAQRDAAVILCRAVEEAMTVSGFSMTRSCRELAARLVSGNAHDELIAAAYTTYAKPRKDAPPLGGVAAQLSRLQKMMAFFEQGRLAGDVGRYLVPGKREKVGHNPVHVTAFLFFFCRPTRPPVSDVHKAMVPWLAERGIDAPSYSTVCKIENDLPVTVKYRGRVTGSEWRGLKPYVDRDVSMFKSNDIWVGDGHSFKAKVQHPIHGQPYTPEVTVIIDWVSRKIVGWSIALAESTVAVSDAFRHAQMTTRARPLIYYSDNGSGQTGKMIDCPISGTLARQGIAHETGIPGNPQARGIIERLWQVTLIAQAREYPTCIWRGADDNATNKMLRLLNRKDQGGITIPTFRQFVDDVAATVARYNLEHEHRELGGRTPEDEYQARLDKDSIVFGPSDTEINALWMPEVTRKPQRGLVSLFGNMYCKRDLVSLLPEGAQVRVRYDLHDADRVWLLTMDGVFLGEAKWDGHKEAAFPIPKIDQLRAERAAGKTKRGEKIIALAQAELGEVYDLTPAVPMPVPMPDYMPVVVAEEEIEEVTPAMSHEDMVMWLYGNHETDSDDEEGSSSEVAAG